MPVFPINRFVQCEYITYWKIIAHTTLVDQGNISVRDSAQVLLAPRCNLPELLLPRVCELLIAQVNWLCLVHRYLVEVQILHLFCQCSIYEL